MSSPLHDLIVWLFAAVGLAAVLVSTLAAIVILGLFQAEGLVLAPKSRTRHSQTREIRKAKALKENNAAIAAVLAREEARAAAKKQQNPPKLLPRTVSKKKTKPVVNKEDSTRPMNKVCPGGGIGGAEFEN